MFTLPAHLHPMVVHFPIALFITALGFEILSFIFKKESLHQSAVCIYVLAALITPLVVRTGIWEAEKLNLAHPMLDQHRNFALWTMWVSLMSLPILWFIKKEFGRYFRIIFLIFLMSTAVFVSLAGDKGGRMVFEYGVGVAE
jgi:uncharacterized membrane protein